MNGSHQAELSGIQPSREVEAEGERGAGGGRTMGNCPAGSELRSQRMRELRLVQVWFTSVSGSMSAYQRAKDSAKRKLASDLKVQVGGKQSPLRTNTKRLEGQENAGLACRRLRSA